MKIKLLLVTILYFNISVSFSQKNDNYNSLIKLANELYKSKDYKNSVENFEKAFDIYSNNKTDLYNAACSASLNLDLDKAKRFLAKSIKNGYSNIEHLHKDPDLFNIHCSKEWQDLIKRVEINHKKTITAEKLSDNIKKFIHKNKTDSILKWTDSNLKIKQTELKKEINIIRQLLRENNITNLYLHRTNSNKSIKWINGINTETYSTKHKITPKYFNGYFSSLLLKPLGHEIKINYSKKENKWLLSELKVNNEYANSQYNMINDINNFFQKSDSLLFVYKLVNNLQKSSSNSHIKNSEINKIITSELKKIEYLKFSEIKHKLLKDDSKIFSLSFLSNKKNDSSTYNFFKQEKKSINTIELVFYDNDSNIILVSNGYKYAFYKANSLNKIKEIVIKKMIEITK